MKRDSEGKTAADEMANSLAAKPEPRRCCSQGAIRFPERLSEIMPLEKSREGSRGSLPWARQLAGEVNELILSLACKIIKPASQTRLE
jgi:hypothetical protein